MCELVSILDVTWKIKLWIKAKGDLLEKWWIINEEFYEKLASLWKWYYVETTCFSSQFREECQSVEDVASSIIWLAISLKEFLNLKSITMLYRIYIRIIFHFINLSFFFIFSNKRSYGRNAHSISFLKFELCNRCYMIDNKKWSSRNIANNGFIVVIQSNFL